MEWSNTLIVLCCKCYVLCICSGSGWLGVPPSTGPLCVSHNGPHLYRGISFWADVWSFPWEVTLSDQHCLWPIIVPIPAAGKTGQTTLTKLCGDTSYRGSTLAEEFRWSQDTDTTIQCWWSSMAVHSYCRKVGSSLGGRVEDACYSRTSDIRHPWWCKVQDSPCQSPAMSHSARLGKHPHSDRLRAEPHHWKCSNSGASHHYRQSCQWTTVPPACSETTRPGWANSGRDDCNRSRITNRTGASVKHSVKHNDL